MSATAMPKLSSERSGFCYGFSRYLLHVGKVSKLFAVVQKTEGSLAWSIATIPVLGSDVAARRWYDLCAVKRYGGRPVSVTQGSPQLSSRDTLRNILCAASVAKDFPNLC